MRRTIRNSDLPDARQRAWNRDAGSAMSFAGESYSMILPASSTRILSKSMTVLSRSVEIVLVGEEEMGRRTNER